jgi:hypothetical protein
VAHVQVRDALSRAEVLALGKSLGENESRFQHFDDDRSKLPVFTSVADLRSALLRRPPWVANDVLLVFGKDLLEWGNATIVINPWSDSEFQVPWDAVSFAIRLAKGRPDLTPEQRGTPEERESREEIVPMSPSRSFPARLIVHT